MKIDFIGAGVNKCGTTWLYRQLAAHPEICMSREKETHYFGRNFYKGPEWFEQQFDHCRGVKIRGEFSPEYLHEEGAMERIAEIAPNAKIIIAIRHPIERLRSCWEFDYRRGSHSHREFLHYLDGNISLRLKQSKYASYLQKVYDLFSADNVHVVIFYDIKHNQLKVLRELYRFLDVDETFIPDEIDKKINVSNQISLRYRPINQVLLFVRRFLKNHQYNEVLVPFFKKIGVNEFVKLIFKLNTTKKMTNYKLKSKLPEGKYRELFSYYKKDILKTSEIIERDLTVIWK